MTDFSSGDVQTSVTMLSGRSLPIWPAGMARVVRMPVTVTPSMVFDPRSSVFTSPGSSAIIALCCMPITCGCKCSVVAGSGAPLMKTAGPLAAVAPETADTDDETDDGVDETKDGPFVAVLSVKFRV